MNPIHVGGLFLGDNIQDVGIIGSKRLEHSIEESTMLNGHGASHAFEENTASHFGMPTIDRIAHAFCHYRRVYRRFKTTFPYRDHRIDDLELPGERGSGERRARSSGFGTDVTRPAGIDKVCKCHTITDCNSSSHNCNFACLVEFST